MSISPRLIPLLSGLIAALPILSTQSVIADTFAPNLSLQVQPTPTLTTGNPLIDVPVVRAKGGSLRAQVTMVSGGFNDHPIRYGDIDVLSSGSQFPNASQTSGSQNTLVYGYAVKAYGKSYPAQFPGPILQLNQGEKLDLDLLDELQTSNGMPSGSLYETNFHGHGLHVSPLSMGDNIYPVIQDPGTPTEPQGMRVRIPIPKNQESGFDWYHPHKHMQTHQQVYGGLAGMIVIGDALDPWPQYKQGGSNPLKQRYIGLSEVNIQKTNTAGTQIDPNGPNRLLVYASANSTQPQLLTNNCFGNANGSVPQCSWQKRVNGQLNPVITMRPGTTEVWNLISMGAFGSFNIAITDSQLQNPWNATILAFDGNESDHFKTQGIDIKPLPMVLSADNNRMNDLLASTLLMPGNRITMAVTAPKKPGTYYLIDGWGGCNSPAVGTTSTGANPKTSSCNPVTYPNGQSYPITYYVLATIVVEGAEVTKPAPVFNIKQADYSLFAATPTAKRQYAFYVDAPNTYLNQNPPLTLKKPAYPLGTCPAGPACFDINGQTFLNSPLTTLQIGSVEEWTLINEKQIILNANGTYNSSNSASHPFHIHQGNFIVTEVNGQPVDPNATSSQSSLNYVSPRDTVNIPQPLPLSGATPVQSSIKIKFKVEDYPGKYVFHCHILKHEDQGMMVPILAVGPVNGLRGAFGSSVGEIGVVNVVDGTGSKTSTKYPFGYAFSGGTSTASALGAAKYYNNYVVGQASGGYGVALYGGRDQKLLHRFQAFSDSGPGQKGVSLALGDINGDGNPEIIVGSRASGAPKLRIYSPSGVLMMKFDGFLSGDYPHGINVAAGDVDGDNFDDIIVGAGAGQAPVVTIYSGRQLTYREGLQSIVQFTAQGDSHSGARVATGYVAPATLPGFIGNVVTTPEAGTGTGTVQIWNTQSTTTPLAPMTSYTPFPGSNLPVQLQTGYVGVPGVAQVFAWNTPNRVASTSFDSSSKATTNYLNLTN
ncbi:MAG: hypothetical protein RL333_897 [Pseudomonadota bacterium]|jgi:FtsP/CotA-like multicopper oxidase with cupredoxin domain